MPNNVIPFLVEKYGSADWNQYEAQRWSFYDYVRYPVAGTGSLSFFINALGSADPVSTLPKTLEQTNMVKAGSFGQQYFVLQAIRTHISFLPKVRQLAGISAGTRLLTDSTAAAFWASWVNLAHAGVMRFYIQNKETLQLDQPFINAPPGMGLAVDRNAAGSAGAAVVNHAYWAQQSPNENDVFNVPWKVIEPEVQFRLSIDFPDGVKALTQISATNPAVDIGVILDGYIIRPKQ